MILSIAVSLFLSCQSSPAAPATIRAPLKGIIAMNDSVLEKNFYLFSLISRDQRVLSIFRESSTLSQISTLHAQITGEVFKASESMNISRFSELVFSDQHIESAGVEMVRLYDSSPEVRKMVESKLRPTGMYYRYHNLSGGELLNQAWRDCAAGVNNAIRVYGLGMKGRSNDIDGISYDTKNPIFGGLLHNVLGVVIEDRKPQDGFYADTLRLALRLMEINRRDEAARFEPMERGENKAAYRAIKRTDWSKFQYSSILVPGYGPEEQGVALSPIGKLALGLAVERYKKGWAPFIMVSGGYVHPKQTPYCEALEMKRSLMRDFGIPEKVILIEPHARHTTTSLRNAARLLYRYEIPFEKAVVVTTNTYQSKEIESRAFADRCQRVFGYQPHKVGERLSPFDVVIYPQIDSLYMDPQDPLDP